MRNRSKLLFVGLAATLAMAVAVGSASARRIETSSQTFKAVWNPLVFNDAARVAVSCPVTLAGSFHSRTLSKVSGQLIGYINSATVGTCSGSDSARADTETLPWHIQYNSFEGTLPNITGITLTLPNAKFEITAGGVHCKASNTQTNPAWGTVLVESSGGVTGLRALEAHTIPLEGGGLCPFASPGRFSGTATVTEGGRAASAITVRLVQ